MRTRGATGDAREAARTAPTCSTARSGPASRRRSSRARSGFVFLPGGSRPPTALRRGLEVAVVSNWDIELREHLAARRPRRHLGRGRCPEAGPGTTGSRSIGSESSRRARCTSATATRTGRAPQRRTVVRSRTARGGDGAMAVEAAARPVVSTAGCGSSGSSPRWRTRAASRAASGGRGAALRVVDGGAGTDPVPDRPRRSSS